MSQLWMLTNPKIEGRMCLRIEWPAHNVELLRTVRRDFYGRRWRKLLTSGRHYPFSPRTSPPLRSLFHRLFFPTLSPFLLFGDFSSGFHLDSIRRHTCSNRKINMQTVLPPFLRRLLPPPVPCWHPNIVVVYVHLAV